MPSDKDLLHLLRTDAEAFLKVSQPIVKRVADKFISGGYISAGNREDLVSHINEQLLKSKITQMKAQFTGGSLFTTYFARVLYNISIRYGKKERRYEARFLFDDEASGKASAMAGPLKQVVLNRQKDRFGYLLKLYGKKEGRLVLLLKIILRLNLTREDVLRAFSGAESKEMDELLCVLGTPVENNPEKITDHDLFEMITPWFNRFENRNNTPDALRKWLDYQLNELAVSLNAPPYNAEFDKKTVKLLAEFYFTSLHNDPENESN